MLSLPAAEREQMGRVPPHRGLPQRENTWRTFEELYVSDAPYQHYLDSRR